MLAVVDGQIVWRLSIQVAWVVSMASTASLVALSRLLVCRHPAAPRFSLFQLDNPDRFDLI